VTLVEIDPALAALAAQNAARNAMADRAAVATLDVAVSETAFVQAGLVSGSVDHVLMNPPFHDAQRAQPSPDAAKRSAHLAHKDSFSVWAKTAARLLRPDGSLTVIYRADGLDEVLAALAEDFGAARVLPVSPKPGAVPIRVIVQAIRGDKRKAVTAAEIYLNDADGRPSANAEAVLRDAAALTLV
jgi:tRNA1(Val) A37 N6-methylase TrmN6